MSGCHSCDAEVTWAIVISSGKRMPLDTQPADDGNVVIDFYDNRGVPHVRVLKKDEIPGHGGGRYKSHFATCPSAERHRR